MPDDTSRTDDRRDSDLHVLCTTPLWASFSYLASRRDRRASYDRVWGFTASGRPMIVDGDDGRLVALGRDDAGDHVPVTDLALHDLEEDAASTYEALQSMFETLRGDA